MSTQCLSIISFRNPRQPLVNYDIRFIYTQITRQVQPYNYTLILQIEFDRLILHLNSILLSIGTCLYPVLKVCTRGLTICVWIK